MQELFTKPDRFISAVYILKQMNFLESVTLLFLTYYAIRQFKVIMILMK